MGVALRKSSGEKSRLWYGPRMRRNAKSITTSPEIVKHIDGLTEANFNLLTRLITWLDENEKRQRKFMNCVLIRLSKIETMLIEVQGCQVADYWSPGKVTDGKRAEYLNELEARMNLGSQQMGLKMIRYIYGKDPTAESRHDRRRRWSDWEI